MFFGKITTVNFRKGSGGYYLLRCAKMMKYGKDSQKRLVLLIYLSHDEILPDEVISLCKRITSSDCTRLDGFRFIQPPAIQIHQGN